MANRVIIGYHTQHHVFLSRTFPILAEGYEEWLGDGYYFWEDEYFANWWGKEKKCDPSNRTRRYTIYQSILEFDEEDFIDTVFNEEDYYNFVKTVEKFSKELQKNLKRKPDLREFNQFISDFNIWEGIKVIRFQDLPKKDEHIEVKEFYYKKRIQIRVSDPKIITTFTVHKNMACI
jgi:hypothetical protein